VSYADLNLASSAGQDAVQRRIQAAARQVCGTTSFRNAGGLRSAAANRRCIDEAIAEALSALAVKTRSLASAR
jgi:UrcA family protein